MTEILVRAYTSKVEILEDSIKSWHEKFSECPWYWLEWSDRTFEDASRLRFYKELLEYLKNEMDSGAPAKEYIPRLAVSFTDEALRLARSPSNSTSDASRMTSKYATKIIAEIANDLTNQAKRMVGNED